MLRAYEDLGLLLSRAASERAAYLSHNVMGIRLSRDRSHLIGAFGLYADEVYLFWFRAQESNVH